MKLLMWLCAIAGLSTTTAAVAANAPANSSSHPNVIIIIADDQGYHDLGVQGAKDIKTPNIDSLAASGVRFTQGYVTCPVCSPSRAGLLTGRYQQRFGHEFNPGPNAADNFGLPTDQKTIANYLKDAGYVTGAIGKWHQGNRDGYRPLQRGFDSYYGFLGGAHSYVPLERQGGPNSVMRDDKPVDAPPYLTTAFNAEAQQFIDKNHDHLFFLYLAYNAIHSPLQAAPNMAERFPDIKDQRRLTMATMLAALDDGVGAILGQLKKYGIEENTLVIYVSDNGGPTAGNTSRNDPLSGFKGETLEGGIRIPMIARWPGKLPGGTVYDKPVISLDFLPTALAAAGTTVSKEVALDGVNLLPYLKGENSGAPHDSLFWRFGRQMAVRSGDWKLVRSREQPTQLFNLAKDIGEKTDLATSEPEVAKRLQAAFEEWDSKNVAPLWHDTRQAKKELRPRVADKADRQARRAAKADEPGKQGKPGKRARRGQMQASDAVTSGSGTEDDE
jgi:arylsulfatase A-like enzyme